jgi:hypothetical protein
MTPGGLASVRWYDGSDELVSQGILPRARSGTRRLESDDRDKQPTAACLCSETPSEISPV